MTRTEEATLWMSGWSEVLQDSTLSAWTQTLSCGATHSFWCSRCWLVQRCVLCFNRLRHNEQIGSLLSCGLCLPPAVQMNVWRISGLMYISVCVHRNWQDFDLTTQRCYSPDDNQLLSSQSGGNDENSIWHQNMTVSVHLHWQIRCEWIIPSFTLCFALMKLSMIDPSKKSQKLLENNSVNVVEFISYISRCALSCSFSVLWTAQRFVVV